jgi:transcription factor E2F3
VLTKKFVNLIQNAENKCIDLNEAVTVTSTQLLKVQKRRIYDITNVLEGIGLIQKRNKNKIQWVGGSEGNEHAYFQEAASLNRELEELVLEEQSLDYWIGQMQDSLTQMTKDPAYAEYAYVTYDDIKSLSNLTEAENETLLAIRAPPGTSLEVPDPESLPEDEKERYQIYLTSKTGEILIYVVSNDKLQFSQEQEPQVLSTNTYRLSKHVADDLRDAAVQEYALKHEGISDMFASS